MSFLDKWSMFLSGMIQKVLRFLMGVCSQCGHDVHKKGECKFLYVYARGPGSLPGNQQCLCGYK